MREIEVGDTVVCKHDYPGQFTKGNKYTVRKVGEHSIFVECDDAGSITNGWSKGQFELVVPQAGDWVTLRDSIDNQVYSSLRDYIGVPMQVTHAMGDFVATSVLPFGTSWINSRFKVVDAPAPTPVAEAEAEEAEAEEVFGDEEATVLADVVELLVPLDFGQQQRILNYLNERF